MRSIALGVLVACASAGCVRSVPRPHEAVAKGGGGSSLREPILLRHMGDEVAVIQADRCPQGGHRLVGRDTPLYSHQRHCLLDMVEGSCGADVRDYFFLVCE